jgi:hypothetical protein
MAVSADIRKLRNKIGDSQSPHAFDDAELSDILDDEPSMAHAVRESLWQLLTEAAKRNNYTTGLRREDKKQVFDNLLELYKMTHDLIIYGSGNGSGAGGYQQVAIIDLRAVGPYVEPHDYTSLLTGTTPW